MLSSRLHPAALLVGAALAAPALAGPSDPLHVYGGLGWAYDDNLLRVPKGSPGFDNTRGDSWFQAEAGLIFDKTYGRQRFNAVAKLSKVTFDHFSQLDYDGKDLQLTWYWQLPHRFEGKAGWTYNQVLAPYTDVRTDQRNLRQQRHGFFDGGWRFHPSWKGRFARSNDKFTYELPSQRYNNRSEDTTELEADYLPKSGSTVGLVLRRIEGSYPNRRPVGQVLLNDDFTQDEVKARVNWMATGLTSVQLLAGWARRKQPSLGGDNSGFNGKVTALYTPRGTLSYNAALWRDFAPLESSLVSYTLNKGATIGASWEATTKIKVDANATWERRSYNPRLAFLGQFNLKDSIRTANLRATWTVRPTLQLSAGYAHQARSGSVVLGTGSFSSNSASFNASAQF